MQGGHALQHVLPDMSQRCQLVLQGEKKKKWEPPPPPPRVGRKQRRAAAAGLGSKLPAVTPNAKCKLRLLKLERIKDWLLMEEEFLTNQERLRPQEERNQEDRTKVHHIVSWHVALQYTNHIRLKPVSRKHAPAGMA